MELEAIVPFVPPREAHRLKREGYKRIKIKNVEEKTGIGAGVYYVGNREEQNTEVFIKAVEPLPQNIERLKKLILRLRSTADDVSRKIVRGERMLPSSIVYSIPLGLGKKGSSYYVVYSYIKGATASIEDDSHVKLYEDLYKDDSGELRKALLLDFAAIAYLLHKAQVLHTDIEMRNVIFAYAKGRSRYGVVLIDIDDAWLKEDNRYLVGMKYGGEIVVGGRDRPPVPDHPSRAFKTSTRDTSKVKLESDRRREGFVYAYLNSRGVRESDSRARRLIFRNGLLGFLAIRKTKFLDMFYEILQEKAKERVKKGNLRFTRPPEESLKEIIVEAALEAKAKLNLKKDPIDEDTFEEFEKHLGRNIVIRDISRLVGKAMVFGYYNPRARVSPERVLRTFSGSIYGRVSKDVAFRYLDNAPL